MEKDTIIYPTDFSSCAENAVAYLTAIAKSLNCSITVVHIVDTSGIIRAEENPLRVTEDIEKKEMKCQKEFNRLAKKFEHDGVDSKTEVLTGDLSNLLLKYIAQRSASLIVMGTTGTNTLENKILGSQTYKVLRKTDLPVLAIPEKAVFRGLRKIVFATDYHKGDLKHLQFLVRIAKYHEAMVNIVHIADKKLENDKERRHLIDLENKVSMLTNYDKFDYDLLYWKNVEQRLEILLNETDVDMLAVVTRKRDFIDRLFHKSITKRMIYHTQTPMLVFT